MRVLGEDARDRCKFGVAKSYVMGRLTEIRCEERRSVCFPACNCFLF